ncbi:MAG: 3-deoxy-7-phosphoheptulonate synthase, partial [Armatimonadota bacterium]
VDPSHGVGVAKYVPAMSCAALVAGADGLLIEVHPEPRRALSDAAQTLDVDAFRDLMGSLRKFSVMVGKRLTESVRA